MPSRVVGQLARNTKVATSGLSERKHRAIQEAGTSVFLRLGYGSASMDLIAAEARVSKQTIYNHFHSKDELFKAIITDMTAALITPLSMRDAAKSSPERQLRALARDFLTLMLKPSSLSLYRLIVAESGRIPELGGEVYAAGAGRLIAQMADYLAWETKNRRLAVAEPERAAEQFVGMLTGRVQLRALLGVCENPSKEELDGRVEEAVSSFLRLHAPVRSPDYAALHPGYETHSR
ncbi:MAG: TetR family transcriptional regulator [Alphaproteobacteria bacterium]|nr:TetR family transcriptional regulator [Alphaproteobacteria bacterium]